jgi:leucyl-tRNA synthetase
MLFLIYFRKINNKNLIKFPRIINIMQENYNHKIIELNSQKKWEENKVFDINNKKDKPKYYCLAMLPYPSGKLHMGHVRNYTISDVISRFYSFRGFNVLQPFGWDSFGLPAENAAISNHIAPATWTYQNIEYMKMQLKMLGLAVDWNCEIATCTPEYYKWQQWLFIRLYEKGLIYRKNGVVNWDPIDETVLANEQVIDGRGWRSGAIVEKKEIPMYYLKITAYADELLASLDDLTGWPEQVKIMQKNWIGKSIGLQLSFSFDPQYKLEVFTTRADTLMGVTFIAISNDHYLAKQAYKINPELEQITKDYNLGGVSEAEMATKEKLGVFSGLYVIHPVSQEKVPVWIANYVVNNYGTGAVMGVPAHCQRDFDFAKKYNIGIKVVIKVKNITLDNLTRAIAEEIDNNNSLINSGEFDDLCYEEAINKIHDKLNKIGMSEKKVHYRLRDWGLSRQRYWGCPIPIIHCQVCGDVTVRDTDLPVRLPEDVTIEANGSVLTKMESFYKTVCPKCGLDAIRETDTMDTFVDSSWYFLRYPSYDCNNAIIDERSNDWMPVDQYIGGIEHAILHLLYARFLYKAMRDLGVVKHDEPFKNLLTQGMVLANTFYKEDNSGKKTWYNPDNIKFKMDTKGNILESVFMGDGSLVTHGGMEKMSKSKNNGVDPKAIIDNYGADTARLFIMFAAPPELSLEWSENGLEGANRFIKKLWRLVYEHIKNGIIGSYTSGELSSECRKLRTQLHQTIDKVTNDIEKRKQFNTAIASIMELLNNYSKNVYLDDISRSLAQELLQSVVIMLSPIIPHVCEELWSYLVPISKLYQQSWPIVDKNAILSDEVEIIIQVNGKLRAKILVKRNLSNHELEQIALNNNNILKITNNATIKKIIIVPNKIINIVM